LIITSTMGSTVMQKETDEKRSGVANEAFEKWNKGEGD